MINVGILWKIYVYKPLIYQIQILIKKEELLRNYKVSNNSFFSIYFYILIFLLIYIIQPKELC